MPSLLKMTALSVIVILSGMKGIITGETDWNALVFYNNDSFLNTDRAYTAGMQLSVFIPAADDLRELPMFLAFPFRKNRDYRFNFGISFSKALFTPDNISLSELIPGNRPYAGFNYIGFSILGYSAKSATSLEAGIGMTGPLSGAEHLQRSIHRLVGSKDPMGWGNQLRNEYLLQVFFDQLRKLKKLELSQKDWFDVISRLGTGIGNGLIYTNAGISLRCGSGTNDDFGIPSDRPGGLVSPVLFKNTSSGIYGFLSMDVFYHLRNVFLDGNTFRESHHVQKYPFTIDISSGLVIRFTQYHLIMKYTWWTKRYSGELYPHRYIKLGFSCFF